MSAFPRFLERELEDNYIFDTIVVKDYLDGCVSFVFDEGCLGNRERAGSDYGPGVGGHCSGS